MFKKKLLVDNELNETFFFSFSNCHILILYIFKKSDKTPTSSPFLRQINIMPTFEWGNYSFRKLPPYFVTKLLHLIFTPIILSLFSFLVHCQLEQNLSMMMSRGGKSDFFLYVEKDKILLVVII